MVSIERTGSFVSVHVINVVFCLCFFILYWSVVCWRKREKGLSMYLYCYAQVKCWYVKPVNVSLAVLWILFYSILEVVKSTVIVVRSPDVLTELPPAVMCTLLWPSLCSLWPENNYNCNICHYSVFWNIINPRIMTHLVFFVLVSVCLLPLAILPN